MMKQAEKNIGNFFLIKIVSVVEIDLSGN